MYGMMGTFSTLLLRFTVLIKSACCFERQRLVFYVEQCLHIIRPVVPKLLSHCPNQGIDYVLLPSIKFFAFQIENFFLQ